MVFELPLSSFVNYSDILLSYLSGQCLTTKEGSVDTSTHSP